MSHHLEIVKSFDHFLRRYCAVANLKSEPLVNGKNVGESSRAANAIAETKKNQAGRPQVAQWLRDMQVCRLIYQLIRANSNCSL